MKRAPFVLLFAIVLSACASAVPPTAALVVPTQTPTPPALTAAPSPAAKLWISRRGYHAAAYDSHCDRVIVFSGEQAYTDSGIVWLRDTWTYDVVANAWQNMSPAQMPPLGSTPWGDIGEGPMAYDEKADRTIVFVDVIHGDAATLATKTWAYDCATNTWTNLNAKGAPDSLLGARMVYDSKADRMILFGGENGLPASWATDNWTQSTETWAYDYQTNAWTNMHPTVSPPGQNYFPMVYDVLADRVLAWIKPDNDGDNALWAYDYAANTWTPYPMKQPAFRYYNAGAYVPTLKKALFFSGVTADDNETPINDLWTYDSAANAWAQLSPKTGPGPRGWATLTYSSKADKLVLVGGGVDRDNLTNQVWVYDPQEGSWSQAGP